MLVTTPKINKRIVILDTDTGKEWSLHFYYQAGGVPALAFDAPDSIRIILDKDSKNKGSKNGDGEGN